MDQIIPLTDAETARVLRQWCGVEPSGDLIDTLAAQARDHHVPLSNLLRLLLLDAGAAERFFNECPQHSVAMRAAGLLEDYCKRRAALVH